MAESSTATAGIGFPTEGTIKQFPNGRVCTHEACGTRLSIYNDGDFCARHEPMTNLRTRGVKSA